MQSGTVPFRWWICDGWYTPCTPAEVPASDWSHWEVHYDNDLERNKRTSRAFEHMNAKLRTAFLKLRHPDTVTEWSRLMDVSSLMDDPHAHGGGLHYSENGSFLQGHLDYELHPTLAGKERRLNLILFMQPVWRSGWGGQLLLCDATGKAVEEIDPVPGRLVAFECGPQSYHAVREVSHAECPRLSCAVYYLAEARESAARRRAVFFPNRSRGGVPPECQLRQAG